MNSNPTQFIDTHTHLYDQQFRNDRSNVLIEAREAGLIGAISVSENLKDAKFNLKLADIHPEILPAAGLYPGIIDKKQAEQMESFILKKANKLVAIGEVGLDYWIAKEEEDREIQKEIFSRFIDLADEVQLPLNIHSRSAGKYAIDLLLEKGAKEVQLHAFDGKASAAQRAVEAGYYFSIPPSVVRSNQKQKLVKKLPLNCLLLETDSPVLGPDPEKRNVPTNITVSAEAIAEIKGIDIQEVYETTFENTFRLYGRTKAMKKIRYDVSKYLANSKGIPRANLIPNK